MPFTVEQEREFKASFAVRRRRQYLVAVPFAVVLIALVMLNDPKAMDLFGIPPTIWGPALGAAFVGVLVFSFRNWRCPACNGYLGRTMNPRFCPKCGTALQ